MEKTVKKTVPKKGQHSNKGKTGNSKNYTLLDVRSSFNAIMHGPNLPELKKEECLFELFEETALKFPDNPAIIMNQRSVTYSELNSFANKIAAMLREKGVKQNDRVAVLIPKSVECYASILGAMKAGACYIPLDTGYPEDRIRYIIENSMAKFLLVAEGCEGFCSIKNCIPVSEKLVKKYPDTNIPRSESGTTPDDLAYIIYTSGSTGRPKGVMIEHRSACHLVKASQTIYRVTHEDRVYQGFTVAFDASVEEIWMAFLNGAALVPQTDKMKRAGPDLFKILGELKVSIISCVPTLLSMINDDLKSLRLLILGGESCPQSIVERFYKPGRRILNTYGPTEATVIATWSEMKPGEKVTIGKPLPNYSVYVVKEDNSLAKNGEAGELLIGGIGLARGYIGREDLNKEKFIKNTFDNETNAPDRLYRSGDLVVMDDEGNIEFHGRIDSQVKIRGFRVELSEIENVADSFPGIKSTVANVHKFKDSSEALCLYAVPKDKKKGIDVEALFEILKDRLPAYMIPQHFTVLDEMPMLPSGKADRKSLPEPSGKGFSSSRKIIAPVTKEEEKITKVFRQVFKTDVISITDHFFNDLGGHSLFAAQVVSILRKEPEFQGLNISDLYETPTIEGLAAQYHNKHKKAATKTKKTREFKPTSGVKHAVCGIFQAMSLLILITVLCIPIGYIVLNLFANKLTVFNALILIAAYGILYIPLSFLLSLAAKWLIIGRYKEGSYPLWGMYYFRWWLSRLLQGLFPSYILSGTPMMPTYQRLLGAKIGKDCHICTHLLGASDLISIGNETSIAQDCQLLGYMIEDGYINFGKITIGSGCYIATHSSLCMNTTMMDEAMMKEQSMLPQGKTVPAGEFWAGSPARKVAMDKDILELKNRRLTASTGKKIVFSFLYSIIIMIYEILAVVFLVQGFALGYLYFKGPAWMVLVSPITSAVLVLLTCFEIIIFKRLVMNKIKPGIYSVYSLYYLRKWTVDQIIYTSLSILHTLYATLYTIPFLKALGAKIGKRVEVSTVMHISPELFEIGDESFFADASMAGTPKIYANNIMLEKAKVGSRTFIGNSALVPINTDIGNDCLIGVLSIPPEKEKVENGTSWLGTPAMFLHKRDINKDFSEQNTYAPTRTTYLKRLGIEFFRITIPTNIYVLLSYALVYFYNYLATSFTFWPSVLMMSASVVASLTAMLIFVLCLKYSLMGTYKPTVQPLWSSFVWKTELVTGIYEHVLVPQILTPLTGTPILPMILRLFGCRIGKRVFIDTTFISEFDLVKIEDEAAVNFNATMQTHLFEDRVMKMSYLILGKRTSVGNGAVVLYDTIMEEGSKLGSFSLLMKGEELEAGTCWHGNPSRLMD